MFKSKFLVAFSVAALSNVTIAATDSCPGLSGTSAAPNRTADFTDAIAGSCRYQDGNTTAADINAYYPPADWTELDEATASGVDLGELLNVSFTQDANSLQGTWTITNADIWDDYGRLAFSTHIGNGSGSPDSWAWLITPGATSGEFNIEAFSSSQWNGFSNAKLYGSEVPLPAAAWLFGSGLIGLAGIARKRKAS